MNTVFPRIRAQVFISYNSLVKQLKNLVPPYSSCYWHVLVIVNLNLQVKLLRQPSFRNWCLFECRFYMRKYGTSLSLFQGITSTYRYMYCIGRISHPHAVFEVNWQTSHRVLLTIAAMVMANVAKLCQLVFCLTVAVHDYQTAKDSDHHPQKVSTNYRLNCCIMPLQVDDGLNRAQKLLKQSQKRDYYKILGVKRSDITRMVQ